jgi:hypothetical protein
LQYYLLNLNTKDMGKHSTQKLKLVNGEA